MQIIVNGQRYEASVRGGITDPEWNSRSVRKITMAESFEAMQQIFPAGGSVSWATVTEYTDYVAQTDEDGNTVVDEDGKPVMEPVVSERVVDQSDWPLCGPITDNRDGTYTVKMGARLERETRAELDAANEMLRIVMEGE